jgi:hypothetical protein
MTTTQPLHDQQWANAAVYPAGSDTFTGLANKIKPADAEVSRGVVPGKRIGAQWENYWKNSIDVSLDSIMDAPSINYGAQQTLLPATALWRTSSKIVAVKAIPAGETFPRDYLAFADTQSGVWGYAQGRDSTTWVDGTSPAFGGPSSNLCGGFLSGVPQILFVPIGTVGGGGLVAGSFNAKKIAAVAGAWSAAGTIDATGGAASIAMPLYSSIGGVDRFHYPGHNAVNTTPDLATWTQAATGGAGAVYGSGGAASSDGVVYCTVDGSSAPTTEQWYSANGTTWARLTGGPALTSVDFSDTRQEWVGVDAGTGHIWTRPAGMSGSWTDKGNPGWGTVVAVRAFGRCYSVATSLGLFVSRTAAPGTWSAILRPRTSGFTDLIVSAGQLVLAEYEAPSGVAQHHTYRSLRAPWLTF